LADAKELTPKTLCHIQIRNQARKRLEDGPTPPNPFSHGNWRRNLANVLCRPEGYSWLDARAYATEDRRQVNPGLKVAEEVTSAAGDHHTLT
jgi:palmitoyltransferase ZDHHC9/14/18